MAQQGTGKHGHKDSQEPQPHTKENQQGGSHARGGQQEKAQGGKQQERSERGGQHERAHDGGQKGGQQASHSGSDRASSGSDRASGGDDLKQREYKDKDGNVHHHTHTYMDQHKGEGGKGGDR